MASDLEITLKRYNGTDYDTLKPTTTWAQIEGKPTTFTPTSHTHTISDVTNLQTSLDAKLNLAGGTITNSFSTNSNSIYFNTAQTFTGPYLRGQVQDLYRGYYTAQYKIWDEGNDGSGSGLDADTLDGQHATAFADASHTHAATDITSGTIATARLGSGTANSTTCLLYTSPSPRD